jgi:hypothetical protein
LLGKSFWPNDAVSETQEARAERRAHGARGTCPHLQRPEIEPETSESVDDEIDGRMDTDADDADEELLRELWRAALQGDVTALDVSSQY